MLAAKSLRRKTPLPFRYIASLQEVFQHPFYAKQVFSTGAEKLGRMLPMDCETLENQSHK